MHISVTLLQQCLVTNHVQCKRWCPALSSFFLGNGVRAQMGSCLRLTLKNDSPCIQIVTSFLRDCCCLHIYTILKKWRRRYHFYVTYMLSFLREDLFKIRISVCVYRSDFLLTKSTTSEEVDIDDTGRNTIWFFDSEERFSNIGN